MLGDATADLLAITDEINLLTDPNLRVGLQDKDNCIINKTLSINI